MEENNIAMQDVELKAVVAETNPTQPSGRKALLDPTSCFDRWCCQDCQNPMWKEIRFMVVAVTVMLAMAVGLTIIGIAILVYGTTEAMFAGIVVLAAGILFGLACSYPLLKIHRTCQEYQSFEVLDDEGDAERNNAVAASA